ncbi:protein-disulfide reductase DsbD domain-containing protein [Lichenihabitans psoromatis]|uniref:protein-disulfide reductase DsbD domain-containing protein n=1 Tax=Lichenihabitans psoromatis TaxID=2528642 RepID=UPI0013F1604B|nr:protein-disulfide reductase DsbD domain-containing protein [Lichenihabitans psoromatis]
MSPLILAVPLLFASAATSSWAAAPDGSADWVQGDHSAVRLIDAGRVTGQPGSMLGLEIRLDPGYLTYWRTPGDSGVPPTFSTAGSTNVAHIEVEYPAPLKLDEAGSEVFGYKDEVTFPVRLTRIEPAMPATLKLAVDYAICATQCLPVHAMLDLTLTDSGSTDAIAQVQQALAKVPRETPLQSPDRLAIDRVTIDPADLKSLSVVARASTGASLFVEAPEGWYVQAGAASDAGGNAVSFPLTVVQQPAGSDIRAIDLRMTLTDKTGAIETSARGRVASDVGTAGPRP